MFLTIHFKQHHFKLHDPLELFILVFSLALCNSLFLHCLVGDVSALLLLSVLCHFFFFLIFFWPFMALLIGQLKI